MSKVFEDPKHEKIEKMFAEDSSSYVLITCSNPSQEGKMNVEMSSKGDEALISYLIKTAQSHLE